MYKPLGLIAIGVAMSLSSACDQGTAAKQTSGEAVIPVIEQSSTPPIKRGPHGSHDPHANLTAEQHLRVALQHRDEGRPHEAMDVLNQAILQFKQHTGLLVVRSNLLMEQKKISAALADLETAVKLEPENPALLTNRAQLYRQFGRIGEALADLDKAISLDADFIAARFNRGAIRYSSGDFKQALEDFDRCIKLDAKTAAPYFNRAAAHEALGNKDQAIADLKKFMGLTDNAKWKQQGQELMKRWQNNGSEN